MPCQTSALPGYTSEEHGFALDMSGMKLCAEALRDVQESVINIAYQGMIDIEAGKIKNPDEGRQVTHFTDRLAYCDSDVYTQVQEFAEEMRKRKDIDCVIVNGIGGSALGPQLMQFAVRGPYWNELSLAKRDGWLRIYFLDNTDSAGAIDVLQAVEPASAIVLTVSKSGKTRETINNRMALEQAYEKANVDFASHAVAITQEESGLWEYAAGNGWLKMFPMAKSIGGRTSETNIVGHVPAALTGVSFPRFVEGAKTMDAITRAPRVAENPAMQLALAWYVAGNKRGDRNMVIVPYSDRLVLMGKYLQQLVMESLGKEKSLEGETVHQGLSVFGNKGGTDAHAYIQQLNDGRDDFFATFIEILKDGEPTRELEGGCTMGDYLHAFKQGLVRALGDKNRMVIDMVFEQLNEKSLGMLIALYERAVVFYAEMIRVNAFNQPGVESYKDAADTVNMLAKSTRDWLNDLTGEWSGTGVDAAAEAAKMAPAELSASVAGEGREVAALLAKYAVNERVFAGRKVTREYDKGNGVWTFTVA
ncbi:MAG: glucose-6-phosphate isomerase [Lentisphaeria bacterium]|nr:glucose-6-phosphate isomerase [Lentisphaeria bacterium]